MRKHIVRLLTVFTVGVLAMAPVAGAYRIPGAKPGKSGGPPTHPHGGTGTTKKTATNVGDALAGQTNEQLAGTGGFKFTVHFPKAGQIACTVKWNGTKIGFGLTKSSHAGNKALNVTLSASGRVLLELFKGEPVPLEVRCTFRPVHGQPSTSTVHLTTIPA